MGSKILLIDDEELVVKSIEKLLRREGYDVTACRSGEEGIRKAEAEAFDLLICDIRMPKMNGVEVVKKVRETNLERGRKKTKEILVTGYSDDGTNQEALNLEVSEYIYKPFDLRDFLAAIKKTLGA